MSDESKTASYLASDHPVQGIPALHRTQHQRLDRYRERSRLFVCCDLESSINSEKSQHEIDGNKVTHTSLLVLLVS